MNAVTLTIPTTDVTTIDDLVTRFDSDEAENNPDAVVDLDKVRATAEGNIRLPQIGDEFALNDWARGQLAKTLGIRWDRWFENANGQDRADELNRRLARASPSMARPRSALSKFILSLPRDLAVKEVIAKAKAKGLKTDESNVSVDGEGHEALDQP
jgi:hypothetical protein